MNSTNIVEFQSAYKASDSEVVSVAVYSSRFLINQAINTVVLSDPGLKCIALCSTRLELLDYLYEHKPAVVIVHSILENDGFATRDIISSVISGSEATRVVAIID